MAQKIRGLQNGLQRIAQVMRQHAEMVDAWCGFRPGSKDGLPYIGKVDERTYIATGHYRNGILLAPITGKLLGELIVTGKTPELLEPCDPLR